MLRTIVVQLIAVLSIASALAPLAARAQGVEDIQARNSQVVQFNNQGKYAEVVKFAQVTLAEKALRPEHPDTLMSVNNLAALHLAQQDWAGTPAQSTESVAQPSCGACDKISPGNVDGYWSPELMRPHLADTSHHRICRVPTILYAAATARGAPTRSDPPSSSVPA